MPSDDGNVETTDTDHATVEGTMPSAITTALSSHRDHDLRVPFYCEENVWRLAYRKLHLEKTSLATKYVVAFISNEQKSVPMFHQQASLAPSEKPCVWDYHVILLEYLERENHTALVYDVDSTLVPYPISLSEYLVATFALVEQYYPPECSPLFRLVPAELYLQYFASDRSHMYNTRNKAWNEPPPRYACILPSSNTTSHENPKRPWDAAPLVSEHNNLHCYLDFSGRSSIPKNLPAEAFGSILSLQQLREHSFFS